MSKPRTPGRFDTSPCKVPQVARALSASVTGALTLLLVVVATAWAGQYHIYSCSDPVTQAPLPADGWTETPGSEVAPENNCTKGGRGGVLTASLVPYFPKAKTSWTFKAPTGTEVVAAVLYREALTNYKARAYWTSSENNIENTASVFDRCEVPGGPSGDYRLSCERGNIRKYEECTTAPCPTIPFAPSDTLVVPFNHLPTHQLAYDVECLAQGCWGWESLHSADIVLEQREGPTATATGGNLINADILKGTTDVGITASDPISGVFQAILEADGMVVAKQVVDSNGGKCNSYGEEPDGSYIFVYVLPCPPAVSSIDVHFDTAQISDGPHQVSVLVSDAAGNTTLILSRSVTVENNGQYTIEVQRQKALAARGACNAECDDGAHFRAIKPRFTTGIATSDYAHSARTLTGRLLDHTGAAMQGAQIELSQQASYRAAPNVLLATTTTDANGRWTLRAPNGPSRTLTVGYRSRSKDPAYATQLEYRENVLASIGLAAPRRAHPGRGFKFRGQLAGGYIPPGGILVSMEIHYAGKWRTIALPRTDKNGKFSYGYTFAAVEPAIYSFRALLPFTASYPFASAQSRHAHIRLLKR